MKDYQVYTAHITYHYAYVRHMQVNWKQETKKRKDKGKERQHSGKRKRKGKKRKDKKSKERQDKKRKQGKEKTKFVIAADPRD